MHYFNVIGCDLVWAGLKLQGFTKTLWEQVEGPEGQKQNDSWFQLRANDSSHYKGGECRSIVILTHMEFQTTPSSLKILFFLIFTAECNLQIQTYSQIDYRDYISFTVIFLFNIHHCHPEPMEICHLWTGWLEHDTIKKKVIHSFQYR